MKHCTYCGQPVPDTYCSHCGQKSVTERFSWSYIWKEIFHFFTHIEKGFLYTSLRMVQNPGQTVTEFIAGRRKIHQPPVSYFVIWTTLFILMLYLLTNLFGENAVIDYKDYFGPGATTNFALTHLSFILTFIIPLQALYLYVLITRGTYNYVESLIIILYSAGTIILFQFVFALLAFLYFLATSMPVDLRLSDAFKAGYLIWLTISFLKIYPTSLKWLRGSLFVVLAAGTFLAWRFLGVPHIVEYFIH